MGGRICWNTRNRKDIRKGAVEAAVCFALDLVRNPKVSHPMSSYLSYFSTSTSDPCLMRLNGQWPRVV